MSRPTLEDYESTANLLGVQLDFDAVIAPGDMYLAGRNTGIHLLKCHSVKMRSCGCETPNMFCVDWVYADPPESAYPYDGYECVKIIYATGDD